MKSCVQGFILYEVLCALVLGTLVLFYMSSFWVAVCDSLYRLTDSSYTFLAIMHSVSFIRGVIAQAPSERALWEGDFKESTMIEWHENAVSKRLLFKNDMLIFYVQNGKKSFSKVLIKNVVGSFKVLANASAVLGVKMTIHVHMRDMITFFSCLPILKA